MQIEGVGAAQPKGVGVSPKSPQQAEPKQVKSEEEVSLHKPPKWAQVLIQQALQFSLEINGQGYQAPKMKEPEEITPETLFDFQSVADNVLQFVTGRLGAARADGKSDDDLTGMMEQARKGIDKGFGEAKKQLGKWATDNEDIKTGIDQSYKLIQKGLEEFEKEFFGKVSPTDMGQAEMASRQQGYLEIQTKDGDKVVLRFNDSWQTKSQKDESGSQFSLKSSQSFSFSLEGDLNSDEMESIGKLVKGIDELAGNFFSGNFEDLLDKANELKLDDSQLASYSLKLKQSVKLSQTYKGGQLPAGSAQAVCRLSAQAGSGTEAGRYPAAGVPATGADPGSAGRSRSERSGTDQQLHQLQPAHAGGAADDRPVPAVHRARQ